MVKIRLSRGGTKKLPFYRVVVTDSRSCRDGRFIETLGTWDPCAGEGKLVLNKVRYDHWVKQGASPSDMVAALARRPQPETVTATA